MLWSAPVPWSSAGLPPPLASPPVPAPLELWRLCRPPRHLWRKGRSARSAGRRRCGKRPGRCHGTQADGTQADGTGWGRILARAMMTAAATLNRGAQALHFFSGFSGSPGPPGPGPGPSGTSSRRLVSSLSRTSADSGLAVVPVPAASSASSSRARKVRWQRTGPVRAGQELFGVLVHIVAFRHLDLPVPGAGPRGPFAVGTGPAPGYG